MLLALMLIIGETHSIAGRPLSIAPVRGVQQSTMPDIVVVVLDDVGYGDLWSKPRPSIDQLAADGVSFTTCYTHPVCHAARGAAMFGVAWDEFRGNMCDDVVQANAHHASDPTIADLVKQRGYHTGGFGKWHMGPVQGHPWALAPNQLGFDTWRAGIPANVRGYCPPPGAPAGGGGYEDWLRFDDGVVTTETRWTDECVLQEFTAWWQTTPGPRFAWVAFQGAHEPWDVQPPNVQPTASTNNRPRFLKFVDSLDAYVGDLMAIVGPETWVILWGDNGTPGCNPYNGACVTNATAPGANPYRYKLTNYQGGVHVPLVVSGADLPVKGATCAALVQPSDILATLAASIGISIQPLAGSVSFAPCLIDPDSAGARSVCLVRWDGNPNWLPARAAIEVRYKLIVDDNDGSHSLYDLELDPGELVNLYGLPTVATEQARLENEIQGVP